jgi:hypothetical protein
MKSGFLVVVAHCDALAASPLRLVRNPFRFLDGKHSCKLLDDSTLAK